MKFRRPRHLGWIVTAVLVVILIIVSLLPTSVSVEVAYVKRDTVRAVTTADGYIRYPIRHALTMPVSGVITRVTVEPGDSVMEGTLIAWITPPPLDARQREETSATAAAAAAAVEEAKSRMAALSPLVEQAKRKTERLQRMLAEKAVAAETAEDASDALDQLSNEYQAARSRWQAAAQSLRAVNALLSGTGVQRLPLTSPLKGIILRRYEEHARLLAAGSPVVEIGTPTRQELVLDVLSTDAVRMKPGMKVLVDGWGGSYTLLARIRRIEPGATTRISALGVEEKRVNVIAVLDTQEPLLGDAYKADGSVILEEQINVMTVPLGALRRNRNDWYVWMVKEGRAAKVVVQVGLKSTTKVEITGGLSEEEMVILYPPEDLTEGSRVEIKEE